MEMVLEAEVVDATNMKSIRKHLNTAACALLAQSITQAHATDNQWETDSSMMLYSEDERVDVTKFIGQVSGFVAEDHSVDVKVIFDTMSGATPSGAVKQSNLTFSAASANSGISSLNSTSAALANFDDTRIAFIIDWTNSHTRTIDIKYNGAISVENDYRSFSTAATISQETDDKASKYSIGISGTFDEIFRVGDNDTPAQLTPVSDEVFFREGRKNTIDLFVGFSHIINRRTIGNINLSTSFVRGYLTDPYKIFSIVDQNGIEHDQYFEKRPGDRIRNSLSMSLNHQFYPSDNILHADYRYYSDSWEVNSHALNLIYRYKFDKKSFLEPRLRLYTQTRAFFYHNSIFKNPTDLTPTIEVLPEFVSADYRLDDMNTVTLGVTYGRRFGSGGKLRTRLEYITQSFDAAEFDVNDATVFQISYGYQF